MTSRKVRDWALKHLHSPLACRHSRAQRLTAEQLPLDIVIDFHNKSHFSRRRQKGYPAQRGVCVCVCVNHLLAKVSVFRFQVLQGAGSLFRDASQRS